MKGKGVRFPAVLIAIGGFLVMASPAAGATPDTKITSGPSGLIATRSVTFKFSASVAGATFRCRLDAGTWSACASPKSYTGLTQGAHTFRVGAFKSGVGDPTPALRTFTVDTVKPTTTILSGPTGVTANHTPAFRFSSNEPGTFQCRLTTLAFKPCTSPFTPSSPLPDGSYTFRVRARDKAGNVDATPATRAFSVNTPLTNDLPTAEAAAALYFPDAANLDVPASCGSTPAVDCPGGIASPPADQLGITSSRSVVPGGNPSTYDVTATESVQTLLPIKVTVPLVGDCDLTLTSANGSSPNWTVNTSLDFVVDPVSGELRIQPTGTTVNGVEAADVSLSGSIGCSAASLGIGFFVNTLTASFVDYFQQVGELCAAPGPAYLGPCPAP